MSGAGLPCGTCSVDIVTWKYGRKSAASRTVSMSTAGAELARPSGHWAASRCTASTAPGMRGRCSRYREHLPLMPGAVEAVQRLAAQWPLGLASSAPAVLIETVLEAADLRPYFQVTMSTEQVPHGKPAPDIYLAVAGR